MAFVPMAELSMMQRNEEAVVEYVNISISIFVILTT